ncbi:four-carbon acid sugar kinase family protein [Brachybacterium sp. GCM10030252]|uniref:four-carbon acid sugar kinase family protein n=1 Tax=Brachybacterium sp. GCM10030252 TaxID=3273380 RepID=UPI00362334B5
MTTTLDDLVRDKPAPAALSERDVARELTSAPPIRWIVLDDDPTGTQSVRGLPVLTRWKAEDFLWAFETGCPAIYVQTNARSLEPRAAASVMRDVVTTAATTASAAGLDIEVVSRTDSTLRGHFPLDIDVIDEALADSASSPHSPDAVIVLPAFPDAGRVTIDGIHYVCSSDGSATPAASTPFAQDATFGYRNSELRAWVEEKSGGAIREDDVVHLSLPTIRDGVAAVVEALADLTGGRWVTADVVTEADMQVLAAALHKRRAAGATFVYRVGPPFVRALIAQPVAEPLGLSELEEITAANAPSGRGGMIVVGSHVPMTTRQLAVLTARGDCRDVEIDVRALLASSLDDAVDAAVAAAVDGLHQGHVVVSTSRDVIRGIDEDDSLRIARRVSAALVRFTQRVVELCPPSFIIAKGGITSSDVATQGLGIKRALVRGPMLPGIVSLWESVDGDIAGLPFVVFAGNVGDDASLREVVDRLSQVQQSAAHPTTVVTAE